MNLRHTLFSLVFLLLSVIAAKAQVSSYSFTQSTGTYTAITGGTVLATATGNTTATSLDDAVYNIADGSFPFTFTFNGTGYTGCNVSTNGFITFGATAPTTTTYSPISESTAYQGAISAFGGDLNSFFNITGQTGEIRWETVGTAPNREIVIQWKNFRPSFTTSTTNVYAMNYQIRLKETVNEIRVVYGSRSYLVGSTTISSTRQIGLRGATNADYHNRTNSTLVLFTASTLGAANNSLQAFNTTAATPGMPSSGLTYLWSPPPPCSGAPTAGTASAPASVCSGTNFSLTLTGYSTGVSGITFQWQSSPDGITFSNIAGATTAVYTTASQTSATYYQCVVTCTASSASANSNVVNVPMSPFYNCYCASNATNTADTDIGRVDITSGTYGTVFSNGSGTPILSNPAANGTYTNLTAVTPAALYLGENYTERVYQITSGATFYNAFIKVFIDFNQDGDFGDAGEEFAAGGTTANPPAYVDIAVSVPLTAALGITGMRIVMRESGTAGTTTSCGTYTYGETVDYRVNICNGAPAAPTVSGGNTAATPICVSSTPTLSASGDAGATFQWYDAASGGTLLGSGASFTTAALAATTTIYAQQTTACGFSTRTPVTIYIGDLTAPTIADCPSNIILCSAVPLAATWTAPTATDNCTAAGAITVSSTHNSGDVFPIGTTTVTYTFTDANSNAATCSFTVSVNATVPNPTGMNSFYTCIGASSSLTATGTSIQWYSDAGLTTLVATGSPFNIPTPASGSYTYYVTQTIGACESPGRMVALTVGPCAVPPSAPSYLIVESVDTKRLKLRFPDANSDEDKYEIYRSLNGSTWVYHTYVPASSLAEIVFYDSINTQHDTQYFYTVRAKKGTMHSAFTNSASDFTYPNAPVLTITRAACINGTADLKATGTHDSNRFRWYDDATGASTYIGSTGLPYDGSLFTTPLISAARTFYVTAVGKRYESKPRTSVLVDVIARPVVTLIGDLSQRSCGSEITLAIEPVTGATYAWYKNGFLIAGANAHTYNAAEDGKYTASVSNGSCSSLSAEISVDVLYVPKVSILQGKAITFCESGTISAKVREGVSYEWYKDGSLLASTADLIVEEDGTYTLKAIEFGCENTAQITVKLLTFPDMQLNADNEEVCAGEKVTLTAPTFAGTFNWYKGDKYFRTTTSNTIQVAQSGDYSVQLAHSEACTKMSNVVTVTVNKTPKPTYKYVLFGNVTVNIPSGYSVNTITWKINGTDEPSLSGKLEFKPTVPGVYEAVIVYSTGCETSLRLTVSSSILGTDEDNNPETITWAAYPNPANEHLTVKFDNKKGGKVSFEMTDNLGRVLENVSAVHGENSLQLTVAHLPSGIYSLKIKAGELSKTFKIVISR